MQPNLFNYATSELSQDAFFCWLLEWSHDKYKKGNIKEQGLNQIAKELLKLFFSKCNLQLPIINDIKIFKQDGNIDILCIINQEFCLLIEDKVGTVEHSNQLVNYLKYVEDKKQFLAEKIIPIYLQTRDQSNYKKVEKDGFKVVKRNEIIQILTMDKYKEVRGVSDILSDYTLHLEKIQKAVDSFKNKKVDEWGRSAWIGFYLAIQEQFPTATWKYIPNQSKGFMGLWCFKYCLEIFDIYLQIEEQKICFKISMKNNLNRSKTRNKMLKLFKEQAKNFELDIVKPLKFGSGTHMTFALLNNGFNQIKNQDGTINLEKTFDLLERLDKFIGNCVGLLEI